jgi:ribosomal protein S3
MSGRLSGRKQGMAKQCLKRLVCYLLWIKQTVDYDQGFVTTKLGCLGIKVYNFYPLKGKSKAKV